VNTKIKALATTAALALGVGGMADTAGATATAAPYVGALCTVYGDDYLRTQPSASAPTVYKVIPGEDFRVVAVGSYWVYGHTTWSYPTQGWFLSKHMSC
jgi:hypothetical protein